MNKKNRTGDWEYQDIQWVSTDDYIQVQNSTLVLALMDNGILSGTNVSLTEKSNFSDGMKWNKENVTDHWFYLKSMNLERFLTAESNNLTTLTGNK